ncbi:hypothetical protein BVI1335_1520033 [Burkholderia vietnamiensis]|nr:hypothetical protein BVI1335_1520033 [Burkholderia vietnamiensis]
MAVVEPREGLFATHCCRSESHYPASALEPTGVIETIIRRLEVASTLRTSPGDAVGKPRLEQLNRLFGRGTGGMDEVVSGVQRKRIIEWLNQFSTSQFRFYQQGAGKHNALRAHCGVDRYQRLVEPDTGNGFDLRTVETAESSKPRGPVRV